MKHELLLQGKALSKNISINGTDFQNGNITNLLPVCGIMHSKVISYSEKYNFFLQVNGRMFELKEKECNNASRK